MVFSTQASLSAIINPTTIEIPSELQVSNIETSKYDINSAITDLTDKYCNPVSADYDGSKSRNYYYSAEKCSKSKEFFSAISKISELSGKKLVAWDVQIINDGKDVAENILLRTPVTVSVRASDGDGNAISVRTVTSGRVFSLPNLNSRDTIELRLVSTTPVPERFDAQIGEPRVTYSGGVENNKEFSRISGRYAGIVGFIDSLPTVIQIIVILLGSLFITIIRVTPLALLSDANDKRKAKINEDEKEKGN